MQRAGEKEKEREKSDGIKRRINDYNSSGGSIRAEPRLLLRDTPASLYGCCMERRTGRGVTAAAASLALTLQRVSAAALVRSPSQLHHCARSAKADRPRCKFRVVCFLIRTPTTQHLPRAKRDKSVPGVQLKSNFSAKSTKCGTELSVENDILCFGVFA